MYEKKIRPCAIVPPELYVFRDADRQLRQIINDMGRPGYVLVSRQMGKTNLLLNAKREFDSTEHCFVYLDVSNSFADQREFFRNIIDTCIEGCGPNSLDMLTAILESRKQTQGLQAHKEHEYELRWVIDHLDGNLIICLDEIDALTKVDYSDSVFSLIRSIYFSGRTNSPQLKRLTYVLSGVADPAELIKNKAISPFNIGEKIYLDDFSLQECGTFLENCGLHFSSEVIERVYYWAGGYPRVTWDLCSALEVQEHSNPLLTIDDVDRVVGELYLQSFDLPPFDHIRSRVAKERDVRSAVMSMHYGKSAAISDKMKDRLYLAGISKPVSSDGRVSFKNMIMAEALSEKWINDIERESLSLIERASSLAKMGNYPEAIELYREAIQQPQSSESRAAIYLDLGTCYMHQGDIPLAVECFETSSLPNSASQSLKDHRSHGYGICLLLSHRFDDAAEQFEKILDMRSRDETSAHYYETHVNLATALTLKCSESGNFDFDSREYVRAQELLRFIVSNSAVIEAELAPSSSRRILLSANYKLFELSYQVGALVDAEFYIDNALALSDSAGATMLLMRKIQLRQDFESRRAEYAKFVEDFIGSGSTIAPTIPMDVIQFSSERFSELAIILVEHKLSSALLSISKYVAGLSLNGDSDVWRMIHSAVSAEISKQRYHSMFELVRCALNFSSAIPAYDVKVMLVFGIVFSNAADLDSYYKTYLRKVLEDESCPVDEYDFRVIWNLSQYYFDTKQLRKVANIVERGEVAFRRLIAQQSVDNEVLARCAVLLIVIRLFYADMASEKIKLIEEVANYLPDVKRVTSMRFTLFPDGFGAHIGASVAKLLEKLGVGENNRKIGRNDYISVRFPDGRVEKGKYKKYSDLLRSGKCKIAYE